MLLPTEERPMMPARTRRLYPRAVGGPAPRTSGADGGYLEELELLVVVLVADLLDPEAGLADGDSVPLVVELVAAFSPLALASGDAPPLRA